MPRASGARIHHDDSTARPIAEDGARLLDDGIESC
jgi:hypothetical protein